MMRAITAILAVSLLTTAASARDFYVVPYSEEESKAPDGSAEHPFTSVGTATRSNLVSGGDRIILRKGEYGRIKVVGVDFDTPIEIISETPGAAHAEQILIKSSRGLHIQGISVWPNEPNLHLGYLVHARPETSNIRFEGMDIRGGMDAPVRYMMWSKEEWVNTWRAAGVLLDGADNSLTNSQITGISFGVTASGKRAVVRGNTIEGFSRDAMRGLGDGSIFDGNRVENCFKIDENHDDGFQSWATKTDESGQKTISDVVIENNTILEWTGPLEHPLRCTLQGIGLFDGIYKNFTIRNNLVAISAYHGIALYGGTDSLVINNTVVDIGGRTSEFPWIMLSDHKDGWKGKDVLVTNNIAMAFKGIGDAARHNVISRYPARLFRDPTKFDFRLKSDSPLNDSGGLFGVLEHEVTGADRTDSASSGSFELQ